MNKNDEIWLRHMLDAAKEALYFAEGKTRNDLTVEKDLPLLIQNIESVLDRPDK